MYEAFIFGVLEINNKTETTFFCKCIQWPYLDANCSLTLCDFLKAEGGVQSVTGPLCVFVQPLQLLTPWTILGVTMCLVLAFEYVWMCAHCEWTAYRHHLSDPSNETVDKGHFIVFFRCGLSLCDYTVIVLEFKQCCCFKPNYKWLSFKMTNEAIQQKIETKAVISFKFLHLFY